MNTEGTVLSSGYGYFVASLVVSGWLDAFSLSDQTWQAYCYRHPHATSRYYNMWEVSRNQKYKNSLVRSG